MSNATTETLDVTRSTIRGVLQLNPAITPQTIADVDDILLGRKCAVAIREVLETPPIKAKAAARMLGVTPKALLYHARKGRIHRVRVPGSSRSLGYRAADIYAMMQGA